MIPHSRPTLGAEEEKACLKVLRSGQIAQGKCVAEFENKFSKLVKRRYGIAVSSGTSAIHLSLLALGVSKGDEVIIPSFTCTALLHAIGATGAKPVLADINLDDFNLSVHEAKKKISRKTKIIIAAHSFGRPTPMQDLVSLGIPVIEDGTQALGAKIKGDPVGSFGILSLFSFYATKMMTTGEGGMILTSSAKLAEKLYDLRDYDKKNSFSLRTNSKMTDLEAAMGIEQLKKLPAFIKRRRYIAGCYGKAFQNLKAVLPHSDGISSHVYFRYVVRIPKDASSALRSLRKKGVSAIQPVFKPLHRYLGLRDQDFPQTTQAMKEACSIPIYPSLKNSECDRICKAIQML